MSKKINRRNFLKYMGGATVAAAAASCAPSIKDSVTADGPTGEMTYRVNPKTGEKVSILGYGCMRWPTVNNVSGRDEDKPLDQEQINRLVDYALEHGVNYFDSSPAYCKGRSEEATGIALSQIGRAHV